MRKWCACFCRDCKSKGPRRQTDSRCVAVSQEVGLPHIQMSKNTSINSRNFLLSKEGEEREKSPESGQMVWEGLNQCLNWRSEPSGLSCLNHPFPRSFPQILFETLFQHSGSWGWRVNRVLLVFWDFMTFVFVFLILIGFYYVAQAGLGPLILQPKLGLQACVSMLGQL